LVRADPVEKQRSLRPPIAGLRPKVCSPGKRAGGGKGEKRIEHEEEKRKGNGGKPKKIVKEKR